MKGKNLEIVIEDFRSVKSAKLVIDGITVLAGENGSGKSTISKLIYYLYKTIENYDTLVGKNLSATLEDVFKFYQIAIQESGKDQNGKSIRNQLRRDLSIVKHNLENFFDPEHSFEEMDRFMDSFRYLYDREQPNPYFFDRLSFIAKDIVKKTENKSKDYEGMSAFEAIEFFTKNIFKEYSSLAKSRSSKIFKNQLKEVFHESILPKRFEVFEYGTEVISLNKNHLSIPYNIQNVLYIDTPMMLGVETFTQKHWEDFNEQIIINKNTSKSRNPLSELIKNEVIKGEASYEEEIFIDQFLFKRADGKVFNLLDCATGVKSFSILQMLLKNGHLNEKTLLIIDEPESHLHPQWIIEYSRLIVLINKHFGVRFLLASHNPDMVSALKHISNKEDVSISTNFYLARNSPSNNYMYNFEDLEQNIEPIFESFNIAFERIELYGDTSD
jgi:predicted ATP-dependent endonuclease of OLD family